MQVNCTRCYFYPASYGIVEHAASQAYTVNDNTLTITLTRGDLRGQSLKQLDGVLLIGERAADGILKRAFTVAIPATPMQSSTSLGLILLFALTGGLLLNIMPCVFPILSVKALQIVQSAAQTPAAVRSNGVAFTLGVLISFALIAALLLLLRASGEAIGWGFQLQSPVFVLILTWLLFAMGLMFSGLWSFGESFMGLGQQLTTRSRQSRCVLYRRARRDCRHPLHGTLYGHRTRLCLEPVECDGTVNLYRVGCRHGIALVIDQLLARLIELATQTRRLDGTDETNPRLSVVCHGGLVTVGAEPASGSSQPVSGLHVPGAAELFVMVLATTAHDHTLNV